MITAASAGLQNVSMKYNGNAPAGQDKWSVVAPYFAIRPEMIFVPTRKIELIADGSTKLDMTNREIQVTAKVLPGNASIKEINWNPVFKECISSDNIEVSGNGETRIIREAGDGECILRWTARYGTK